MRIGTVASIAAAAAAGRGSRSRPSAAQSSRATPSGRSRSTRHSSRHGLLRRRALAFHHAVQCGRSPWPSGVHNYLASLVVNRRPARRAGPWLIHFFPRDARDDKTRSIPAIGFLDQVLAKVRAEMQAVLEAVAEAPPPAFGRRQVGGDARRHGWLLRGARARSRPSQPSALLHPRAGCSRSRWVEHRRDRWTVEAGPSSRGPTGLVVRRSRASASCQRAARHDGRASCVARR